LQGGREAYGIVLGSGYKNDQACATFVEYIALEQSTTS